MPAGQPVLTPLSGVTQSEHGWTEGRSAKVKFGSIDDGSYMKIILKAFLLALSAVAGASADEVISDAKANQLLATYNCLTCHTVYKSSLPAPSFRDIAKKYASDPQAVGDLEASVLNGSSGTWGDSAMPSSDVPNGDLQALIVWILQLM
jgi:cytochrome c